MRGKIFWTIALIYFAATSLIYLRSSSMSRSPLRFLYPDEATILRIEAAQTEQGSSVPTLITHIFANKPVGYLQTYLDNAYRSADIPFLFTLTDGSSMYDDQGPMQMLFPWELLLFIPAIIFPIRSQNKRYIWFVYLFLASILLPSFLLPPLEKIKLFPEVIIIRLVIVLGWYEGIFKWLKK